MIGLFTRVFLKNDNRLRKYYDAKRRAKAIKNLKCKIPPYLKDNNFMTELNYKLWVTKGARFKASERCEELDRRSARLVGWLSAYLIILSVLPFCNIPELSLPGNYTAFISVSLSIMILVFSQLEYAMNYTAMAKDYHNCALEVANLYNELRYLKSDSDGKLGDETISKMRKISANYEQTLQKYKNHLPIGYDIFRTDKPEYFNLSWLSVRKIKMRYFMKTKFVNYFFIYGLPVIYAIGVYFYKCRI